jgi:phage tail sheath protein FI
MSNYKHGINIIEVPTSISPPAQTTAGLPVVVGTAPINLAETQEYVNKPTLVYSYEEAVKNLGYSSDWDKYTLCEVMKSHLQLFNVAPVIFINVLDPDRHKKDTVNSVLNLTNGSAIIEQDGVLLNTLVVKLDAASQPLTKGTDYTAAFDQEGKVVITRIADGGIPSGQTTLNVSFSYLDPTMVTSTDIIGGVDATTGKATGLELINQVFPLFRMVPGQILAPGWSHKPDVAAIMKAKAGNINGLFKAITVTDVDSSASGADLYTEVPSWKSSNNYTDPLQVVCWPKVTLGGETYHLSTQFAGATCKTDADSDDIPYVSPSNKPLQADGAVIEDGSEVTLGPDQSNYLNSQGIVTALNFIGGWKLWGNRTGAYPGNTDVKDTYISVRRMFNWIGNTIILTFWKHVDNPTNRRMIDTVVDSLNIWLNGLTARGALLGGRVEFRKEENSISDLMKGIVRFHVFLTPPTPAESMEFSLEFDTSYLNSLFA